jgi:hypothetical protein
MNTLRSQSTTCSHPNLMGMAGHCVHCDVDVAAHTPGPWNAGDGKQNGTSLMVYCNDSLGSRVADCSNSGHGITDAQDEANARLIAAAPDLLALAKKLASECAECRGRGYTFSDDGIVGFGPDDRLPTREACADCADIREVVAKAEGRS